MPVFFVCAECVQETDTLIEERFANISTSVQCSRCMQRCKARDGCMVESRVTFKRIEFLNRG